MFKKEFFGVLLLVSLVSTVMFAGVVWSGGAPAISVYPATGITASSDVYIRVTGTGWASGLPVTLYWDQQNDNHTFAIVTPGTSGSFRLDQLEIENVPIGLHTIIAVQGLSVATATYTVTATLPPDDRLLSPIQQIENKLDNGTFGLPGIQSNFTTVINDLNEISEQLEDKPTIFERTNTFTISENGTYYIAIRSSENYQVKAVYVDITPHSGSISVSYPNITYYNDPRLFYISCTPYTPSPAYRPSELLSSMKVGLYPAGSGWDWTLIGATISGAYDSKYTMFVEAVVESAQDAFVTVGLRAPSSPPD